MLEDIRAQAEMAALRVLNPFFYAIRQRVRFRRSGYREEPRGGSPLPAGVTDQLRSDRANRLAGLFDLKALQQSLSEASWAKTLHHCDRIDRLVALGALPAIPTSIHLLDIGAKNFDSAPGLFFGFRRTDGGAPRRVRMTGIEIDPHRVYRNLHSRADAANYYLSLLPPPGGGEQHRYLGIDLLTHRDRYDIITWFNPFVDPYPLLHWGLPSRMLRPQEMLGHALSLLLPGGFALISYQHAHERDIHADLLTRERIAFKSLELRDLIGQPKKTDLLHIVRRD